MANTQLNPTSECLVDQQERLLPASTQRLRTRAWLIGLATVPLVVFWVEYTEIVAQGPDLAAMSLPIASMFTLMLLIAPNVLVRRYWPGEALTQAELLAVLSMNTIGVYVCGIGMMQFLNPLLVGFSYFQTPQNGWANWIPLIRRWAAPDSSVVSGYYLGRSSFFTAGHIQGWAAPILIWTTFIFVLLFCMYCIGSLMRRQWVENERMLFPIVQIPLEITRDGGATPLWRNTLLWAGVMAASIPEIIAAIHFTSAPTMPYLPIKPEDRLEFGHLFTTPPWNAIGYLTLSFYPLVIGLSYLLSLDVSFSCWFSYLAAKGENILCAAFGFRDPGAPPAMADMPYNTEQSVGAFIGLALYSVWLARKHFATVWKTATGGDAGRSGDDAREPMSYRAALIGLVVSGALLIAFGVAIGLSFLVSCAFFVIFFVMALAFSRIRAEAGLPWGNGPYGLTHGNLVSIFGAASFDKQNMVGLTMLGWFDSDWRCLPQPAQIEAMKMAGDSAPRPLNQRHLTAAILAATLIGVISAWVSCLGIYYHYGASTASVNQWRTAVGHYPFEQLQNWIDTPKLFDSSKMTAVVVGLLATAALGALRVRYIWWPLHPVGYALCGTNTMEWIWFAVFLGWLVKSALLRYAGVRVYRRALPFFIGLILGDYAISGLLSLLFLATGHPGYRTFPI